MSSRASPFARPGTQTLARGPGSRLSPHTCGSAGMTIFAWAGRAASSTIGGRLVTSSRASGRLREAKSVAQNKRRDGAAWPRSLHMDLGCGPLPPRACQLSASAPALASGTSRMSCGSRFAIPEPSNPPSAPASPFERAFHRAASLEARARQAANPRHTDFSARPRMLSSTHVSRHELMPFACGEMDASMRAGARAGISFGGKFGGWLVVGAGSAMGEQQTSARPVRNTCAM